MYRICNIHIVYDFFRPAVVFTVTVGVMIDPFDNRKPHTNTIAFHAEIDAAEKIILTVCLVFVQFLTL